MNPETYRRLLGSDPAPNLSVKEHLDLLARFIDFASDARDEAGARRAVGLAKRLRDAKTLTEEDSTLLHYFAANACRILKPSPIPGSPNVWAWYDEAIEDEIRYLRLARRSLGFPKLEAYTQGQIQTNLGNAMSTLGRFAEAIECFDRALIAWPSHGMARGDRGICVRAYASPLPHLPHAPGFCTTSAFLREARKDLEQSLRLPLEGDAREHFEANLRQVTDLISEVHSADGFARDEELHAGSLQERVYRKWSLRNRLFLNPLNDIRTHPQAACDVLHLPTFTAEPQRGPLLLGLFNQMKIEFVTARLLLFEGVTSSEGHLADQGVLIADTLDCSLFSVGTEKMRCAYRSAYSIFDKIAFFLNFYLELQIPAADISFRRVWLKTEKRAKTLRAEFESRPNWAMRGLYWVSRDLQAHKTDTNAIDPDAKDLARIRNHIEHCHLRIHDESWVLSGRGPGGEAADGSFYSVDRDDFTRRALRLLKLARSALIYLAFSVDAEEAARSPQTP